MAGKFVIKKVKTGFKFDLKAANHETIASSEVYAKVGSAMDGIKSIKNVVQKVHVEDQTIEKYIPMKCPKFQIFEDKAGEFRFRLKATNGRVIATSEGYKTKESCKNGINSVIKNAPDAEVVEAEE